MKRLFSISLLILFFNAISSAQSQSSCPEVKFTEPSFIAYVHTNDTMPFSISLSDESKNLKLEYNWTVSDGKIIEGQGTYSIKVAITEEMAGQEIIATVKIAGLPENCINKFSNTGHIYPRIADVTPPEEYKTMPLSEERMHLDISLSMLANSPTAVAIFYLNFKNPTSKQINSRIFRILNHVAYRQAPFRDRINFAIVKSDRDFTRILYEPKGSEIRCDDCKIIKIIKGSEFKLLKPRKTIKRQKSKLRS